MEFIEILGLVAGILTSASVIPQLVTTIKRKKASDVSYLMFIVLLVGNSLWIYYGIKKQDFPIISTNILSMVLNIMMLVLKVRYRKKS